jgi:hypothetical protein
MNFFRPKDTKDKKDKLKHDEIDSDKILNRENLDLLDSLIQVH